MLALAVGMIEGMARVAYRIIYGEVLRRIRPVVGAGRGRARRANRARRLVLVLSTRFTATRLSTPITT